MGIMAIIFYMVGSIITYFIIKIAVKNAINESLEDIKPMIKESILEGLSEYEYKKQNKE
jgi:hypothetical protein